MKQHVSTFGVLERHTPGAVLVSRPTVEHWYKLIVLVRCTGEVPVLFNGTDEHLLPARLDTNGLNGSLEILYVPTGRRAIASAGLIVERGVAIVHTFDTPIAVELGENMRIAFLKPTAGEDEIAVAPYER